jgi:hypothetical protein
MINLDGLTCPEHGLVSHIALHESAHAVFAIDLGIPFVEIRIPVLHETAVTVLSTGHGVGGGVLMVDADPANWVGRSPAAALEFVLAGAEAERGAFGHNLDGSDQSDLASWARGIGSIEDATAQVRVLYRQARSSAQERLTLRFQAVKRVMEALTAPLAADGTGFFTNFSEALVLSADDVSKIIGGAAD